jgi:ankyrin repeat protein
MVPEELIKSPDMDHKKRKLWLLWICIPVVIIWLFCGFVYFILLGHHVIRRSLSHFYTPPALSPEKAAVYADFIRLVEAHPEYRRFHLDASGPSKMVISEMLRGNKGFSAYEVDELTRISREFKRINCLSADKYGSYVVFMPGPNYILPTSPGLLYSLDGWNPNDVDDPFFNSRRPFKLIKDRWYTSKRLAICPFCMTSVGWKLPDSYIDLSQRDPGPVSQQAPTILWKAAGSGDFKRIQSLISNGADVNSENEDGLTPLHVAAIHGRGTIVKLLIDHGADVNTKTEDGQTLLHHVAREGHVNVVKLLLDNGSDLSAKDNAERTPLNCALRWRKYDVAELLVARGADVNTKDVTGITPLHYASSSGNGAFVEMLISKDSDVNAKRTNGETPLHYASRAGHLNMAEILVTSGADINAEQEDGLTPLHVSAREGHTNIVRLLLTKGVDVDARSRQGQTAQDLARSAGNSDIVELLQTAQ